LGGVYTSNESWGPGAKVNLGDLGSASGLSTLLVITLLAIAGKVLGCGEGAASLGRKSALIVGVGMVPRGEVGIIVASLGHQAGVFSGTRYTLIIAMSLLTSVIAPPALSALLAYKSHDPSPLRTEGPGDGKSPP